MTAVEKARQAARKVIEKYHYDGICTVTEHNQVMDEDTKITSLQDVVVLENQPCHLVFKDVNSTVQSESAGEVEQTTKLITSPDVTIRPGSKITVTQEGVTTDYTYSGVPAVYATHQEIILDLFERWT